MGMVALENLDAVFADKAPPNPVTLGVAPTS